MTEIPTHSSKTVEWYTPPWLVDVVRSALCGSIDLDPASCADANMLVGAASYYDKDTDGLRSPWAAWTVYCNPPYGRVGGASAASLWLGKAVDEYRAGNFEEGIMLLRFVPDPWMDMMWMEANGIALLKRRVRFVDSMGKLQKSPPQVFHALVYFGESVDRFFVKVREHARIIR